MNGPTLLSATMLPYGLSLLPFRLVATGDFDADGASDFVWQETWVSLAGTHVRICTASCGYVDNVLVSWSVADKQWNIRAVGDLNNDGRPDLIWQHEDGSIATWLLNGVNMLSGTLLSPSQVADTDWRIVGVADFDRDGRQDLVWHHQADGRIAVWFMNGTTQISGTLTNPGQVLDTTWKVRTVGDLNTDGYPDLLWQNIADGRVAVWLMRGLDLIEGTLLSPPLVADLNWQIVGAR
jgi:hypothetical protein